MNDFDAQLAGRLEGLLRAAPATSLPAAGWRTAPRSLQVGAFLAGGAAILLAVVVVAAGLGRAPIATIAVGDLRITAQAGASWTGSVDRETAEATALTKIRSFDPDVEHLTVESVRQVAQVHSVSGPSERIAEFPNAVDAWVFFVRGTSDEWLSTTGWALIDADSGEVILADLLHTNDPVRP